MLYQFTDIKMIIQVELYHLCLPHIVGDIFQCYIEIRMFSCTNPYTNLLITFCSNTAVPTSLNIRNKQHALIDEIVTAYMVYIYTVTPWWWRVNGVHGIKAQLQVEYDETTSI